MAQGVPFGVTEEEVLGVGQTEQQEPTAEDKEADDQEEAEDEDGKENAEPGEIFLVKLRQFLQRWRTSEWTVTPRETRSLSLSTA